MAANLAAMKGTHGRLHALKEEVAGKLLKAQAYPPAHPTGL